jgi:hypothetical protein
MKSSEVPSRMFLNQSARGVLAVALSLLMIPCTQPGLYAQDVPPPPPQDAGYAPPPGPPPGNYAPLGADQLNQLVAPIALYPDALVAQVLTASTYPQQVSEASNWLAQTANMPPEQRAAAANTMGWDPCVKALTAFPSVVSNLARNYQWTAALGNAYYNQPGDVMNAVQAMRIRAQQAGTLRSDSHLRVVDNSGLIMIEPVSPSLVYVPYYDPWAVWGTPLSPWRGYYWGGPPRGVVFGAGFGIGFAAGISLALFSPYPWGYHRWSPNWHGGVVVYNRTTYISRSTTVVNHGYFGYHNRGVYERPGPGVPRNFRPAVTSQSAAFRPGQGRPGEFRNSQYSNRPGTGAQGSPAGRQFGQQPTYNRGQQPVNRGQQPVNTPQQGQRFGQPRPNGPATGGQTPTYSRPSGTTATPGQQGTNRPTPSYRPPSNPSTPTPQARPQQPAGGGGTYRQQHMGGAGASGGTSTPRPQVSAPARPQSSTPSRPQSQPSHQSGGNTQHQQSRGKR